jgi:hypothetical protein
MLLVLVVEPIHADNLTGAGHLEQHMVGFNGV